MRWASGVVVTSERSYLKRFTLYRALIRFLCHFLSLVAYTELWKGQSVNPGEGLSRISALTKKTKCDKHYLSPPWRINVYRRPNTIDSPVENQHPVKRKPIHGLTFKAFRAEKAKILVLCKAKTVLDFGFHGADSGNRIILNGANKTPNCC